MTKIMSCAAVVGLLVASSSSAFAKGPGGGASGASPGQAFIGAGRTPTGGTPGASGYSPGQQYLNNKTTNGAPGASVYAPGFLK
jgi:hypothetical protein